MTRGRGFILEDSQEITPEMIEALDRFSKRFVHRRLVPGVKANMVLVNETGAYEVLMVGPCQEARNDD